jgi:hypothetical protein
MITRLWPKAPFYRITEGQQQQIKASTLLQVFNFKSTPGTGLDRPLGFQDVEAPRFLDSRHMKVVRLSAAFTPQETFLVLISVRG